MPMTKVGVGQSISIIQLDKLHTPPSEGHVEDIAQRTHKFLRPDGADTHIQQELACYASVDGSFWSRATL